MDPIRRLTKTRPTATSARTCPNLTVAETPSRVWNQDPRVQIVWRALLKKNY